MYLLLKNVTSLDRELRNRFRCQKKKKEKIKGEEKSEKKFSGAFDLVSPQIYSFARTLKLAIISPDYIQHDIQKNLKARKYSG